jgi:hypothetical protein
VSFLSCRAPARRRERAGKARREEEPGTYIAAAHLGDERGGDDDGGAEHDEVVLEPEEDGLRCIANRKAGVGQTSVSSETEIQEQCAKPAVATEQ